MTDITIEAPGLATPQVVPPPFGFQPGMSGSEQLAVIFQICESMGVSDVQIRSGFPVYIETNQGMECLQGLGVLSSQDTYEIYRELLRHKEIGSHGFGEDQSSEGGEEKRIDAQISLFNERCVDDFSCNLDLR